LVDQTLWGGAPFPAGFEKWASMLAGTSCYPDRMAKSKKFDLEKPAPVVDDDDEETLAAIDKGMRDAEAGRTVPARKVRRVLPELHAYQDALVRKGLEEMRRGRVVSHESVVNGSGRRRRTTK
jgi:predicted transcriptional regulator